MMAVLLYVCAIALAFILKAHAADSTGTVPADTTTVAGVVELAKSAWQTGLLLVSLVIALAVKVIAKLKTLPYFWDKMRWAIAVVLGVLGAVGLGDTGAHIINLSPSAGALAGLLAALIQNIGKNTGQAVGVFPDPKRPEGNIMTTPKDPE